MPVVSIKLSGSLSREQKKKIAEEITDILERHASKPRRYTSPSRNCPRKTGPSPASSWTRKTNTFPPARDRTWHGRAPGVAVAAS